MDTQELIKNAHRICTTDMGLERIRTNLGLTTDNVLDWCIRQILRPDAEIKVQGKNWYVTIDKCILTINRSSYTVITAHRIKK